MALPARYRSLVQIWEVTKDITAETAISMLREEERRCQEDEANSGDAIAMNAATKAKKHPFRNDKQCDFCNRIGHVEQLCWQKYPEFRPSPEHHQQMKHEKDVAIATGKIAKLKKTL